jgi:hypothetical protein
MENYMKNTYQMTALQMYIHALIMDAYILGRLFKRQSMIDQENIIIYAGEGHTSTYCEFLEFIGCTRILNIPVKFHKNEKKQLIHNQVVEFSKEDKKKSFLFN